MTLQLFNTLSGKKEIFKPLKKGGVGMYNCGPTVYNFAHIGNLRAYVFADILRRTLEWNHYEVKQVINITDVGHLTGDNLGDADTGEDRMEKGATREHKTAKEIADFYTKAFFEDLNKLNAETAGTKFPRPTKHIREQIDLIKVLEKKGFAYKTSDGIYFDTGKFPSYGKLGNINIKGLQEGARVEVNQEKRSQTDFALWKFSKPSEKRQQEWKSPWGIGFPGWHIECSAMSMKYLGETFDIHTGGIDHIPTHHNNEIAQSESATGKTFAHHWLHSAFVNVASGKMGKSEGNFLRLKSLEERDFNPLAYRYWLLGAHYRTAMNFSWEALSDASNALNKLVLAYGELKGSLFTKPNEKYLNDFANAINDDLNTPQAIAVVWKLLKDVGITSAEKKKTIDVFDIVLGLDLKKLARISKKKSVVKVPQDVLALVDRRESARKSKDFTEADELRRQIEKLGYLLKDTETGTKIIKIG